MLCILYSVSVGMSEQPFQICINVTLNATRSSPDSAFEIPWADLIDFHHNRSKTLLGLGRR